MNSNTYCKGQPRVGSFSMARQKTAHQVRIYSEGVQQEANYDLAQPLLNQLEFKMMNHKQQIMVCKL
ncbi:hypothetical protein EFP43_10055 [Lacticaseibacillus paracasei]|nr:hypothetical protein [Lacticaseibacillus paracasei]